MAIRRTIGRLAKEAGVSVETVRFYERKGLIRRPQAAGGPRDYDDRTLAELRYVKVAQGLGLSLAEIATLKLRLGDGKGFCASVRTMIEGKLDRLAEERRRIEQIQAELMQVQANCLRHAGAPDCPVLRALHAEAVVPAPERAA